MSEGRSCVGNGVLVAFLEILHCAVIIDVTRKFALEIDASISYSDF